MQFKLQNPGKPWDIGDDPKDDNLRILPVMLSGDQYVSHPFDYYQGDDHGEMLYALAGTKRLPKLGLDAEQRWGRLRGYELRVFDDVENFHAI